MYFGDSIILGRRQRRGVRLPSQGGVQYQILARFPVDIAAPITTPYAADIGTLNLVQNDGQLSITGNRLRFPGQTTPLSGDQGFYAEKVGGGSLSRVAGRALMYRINMDAVAGTLYPSVGFSRLAAIHPNNYDSQVFITNGLLGFALSNSSNPGSVFPVSAGVDYDIAEVLRNIGYYAFIKGGAWSAWSLVWKTVIGTSANLWPAFDNYNGVGYLDDFRTYDLPAPFANDAIATINVSSPPNATSYSGVADCVIDLTLTAAAVLLSNGGFRFRVVDANNYWIVYFNTSGALRIDSVVAGTPTNRLNVAGIITGSATRIVRVYMSGSSIYAFTATAGVFTQRGTTITNTTHQTATGIYTDFGSDWTAANLEHCEVAASVYGLLNAG